MAWELLYATSVAKKKKSFKKQKKKKKIWWKILDIHPFLLRFP